MKALIAILLSALAFSCGALGSAGPALLFSTVETTVGAQDAPMATLGLDILGGNFVLVLDGEAAFGVYRTGTDIPVVVQGEPLSRDYSGAKVVMVHIGDEAGTMRLEIGLSDLVPPEWQPAVRASVTPATLARLQARGILTFQGPPK